MIKKMSKYCWNSFKRLYLILFYFWYTRYIFVVRSIVSATACLEYLFCNDQK